MKNRIVDQEFDGKVYKLRGFSYRAAMLLEEEFNKNVGELKSTRDNFEWVYCLFSALNKDFPYSYEEFIDKMDENPEMMAKIGENVGSAKK